MYDISLYYCSRLYENVIGNKVRLRALRTNNSKIIKKDKNANVHYY